MVLARRVPAVALCVVVLLSGCLDEEAGGFSAPGGASDAAAGPSDALAPGHIVGLVVDPELVPLAEATVSVVGGDLFAVTDAAGAFDLGPLEPGKYVVLAEKGGYASASLNVSVSGDRGLDVTLTLHPVAADVPYHQSTTKTLYIICAFSVRVAVTPDVGGQTTAPCAGLADLLLQTATGQRHTNTLDNWTFDFTIENRGFKSLVMEMTWPPQQFGTNGLMQLSELATAAGGTSGVTVGGTVYGGAMAQPYHDVIHAGRSYWVSGGKNVTFYPRENETQSFQMLVAGYYGNTSVPAGGSAVFINFRPTVWLTFFYNRQAPDDFTVLPDR